MAKLGPPFGRIPWNKGIQVGDKIRKKKLYLPINCFHCDNEFYSYPSKKRKYCSPSCRSKATTVKENNPNWKGGVSKTLRGQDMSTPQYKDWRHSVFQRDNYKCVMCNSVGYLEADHILPYSKYPEHRYNVDNGRTLCKPCHKNTDTYAGRTK